MSAEQAVRARALPRPSVQPEPRSAPRLRLVRPPAQARSHVPFVVVCMAVLIVALLSALLLNTRLAAGSYEQHKLDVQLAELARTEQDLSAQLDQNSAPAQLAERAAALGMEPAGSTGWLRLSDGTVRGAGQ
ncbi:hypothetical protein [Cellulomonas sp. RIT-PI-Y]|uniref:hypothetical protein n=1 Tax=Cellulomonas sp. RIT-PI-Y TaxID=3035297 RepID=UPI0021D8A56F|nr:hypothetical protein [Cellulomonas sp. RIT-PI-Y]